MVQSARCLGCFPGCINTGQSAKAAAYGVGSGVAFGAAAAMGVLSVYYGNQAEDWRGDFEDLPPGLAQSEYDKAFDSWQSFEDKSDTTGRLRNVGLALVGVLYVASWWDVISTQPGSGSAVSRFEVRPVMVADKGVVGFALIHEF